MRGAYPFFDGNSAGFSKLQAILRCGFVAIGIFVCYIAQIWLKERSAYFHHNFPAADVAQVLRLKMFGISAVGLGLAAYGIMAPRRFFTKDQG
jgi:hypothetical protein